MTQRSAPQVIALVVGEASGDILGAGLVRALKKKFPDCRFEGIGGPRMQAEGFISHFPMERLAVMGLIEPLMRLHELLSILRALKQRYIKHPPDMFIGIDAPDFNLRLEFALKKAGIYTVHYVSPSVWAWRRGRIKKIEKSVDLMLTLFPFEADFYRGHKVDVAFVGHPLADDIDLDSSPELARECLDLTSGKRYIALLPGSRKSEVKQLLRVFLDSAQQIVNQLPDVSFVIPSANSARHKDIAVGLEAYPDLDVVLIEGQSHTVMQACELVIMASGTTTLEAMLLKRPMVIAYRMATLSYAIISRLVKVPFIGLPNLLAGKLLVPELIQRQVKPQLIAAQALKFLGDASVRQSLLNDFRSIHLQLRKNASERACEEILTRWRLR